MNGRLLRLWAALAAGSLSLAPQAGPPSRLVEWPYYGGDQGNSRYSPLADVTRDNVGRLQAAWQWKHWETPLEKYGTTPGFFENTPLTVTICSVSNAAVP